MIGLTDVEVYNSIFNKTEENKKFKLYNFPDEKAVNIPYTKVRDEIEKDLDFSDNTATDIQDDLIDPIIIKEYREQVTKKMGDVEYVNITAGYISSIFQDFESYLRTEVDLVEDDIKLVLDEYNSNFTTYELQRGIYTFKDLSEVFFNILQPEYPGPSNVIVIEFDDMTMKNNWLLDQVL